MQLTSDDPFWRGESMARAIPWLAGAAVIAVVVGGLGWLAQRNERAHLPSFAPDADGHPAMFETYSLSGHVLAMVLLAALAVSVSAVLWADGNRVIAVIAIAATAVGPMTVVAAPLDASFQASAESTDVAVWWHADVALGLLALLAGWTFFAVRRGLRPRAASAHATRRFDGTAFVVLFGLGSTVALALRPDSDETPSYLTVACWTALAAASALALWRSRAASSLFLTILPALSLAAMYGAYFRPGGWPGVAGWELSTSPIVFGIPSVAMSLSVPIVVWLARAVRVARTNAKHVATFEPALST